MFGTAVTLATILVSAVSANPTCKYWNETSSHLICEAGKDKYTLSEGLVSENNKTTAITLRGCRISGIRNKSFHNIFLLDYLDISNNNIQRLSLGVLSGTEGVTYLNMSNNAITDFPLGLFDNNLKLEILDVKGNKLNSIRPGVFDALTKLKHLDLASNLLNGQELKPFIFDKNNLLQFLDFSRNDMSKTPDQLLNSLTKLDLLNLDRCLLKEVLYFATVRSLEKLNHLIISNNQIEKLDRSNTFQNLLELKVLHLNGNSLTTIHEDIFQPLKKLSLVTLRNNRLTILPEKLFKNLNSLVAIDLANNQLKYIPVDAFRLLVLKNLNLSGNRFSYLQDNFVHGIRNSSPRFVKFLFTRNPWQCHCLREVLNEVKQYDMEYDTGKYTGQAVVCVSSKDSECKRTEIDNVKYIALYDSAFTKASTVL